MTEEAKLMQFTEEKDTGVHITNEANKPCLQCKEAVKSELKPWVLFIELLHFLTEPDYQLCIKLM